MLNHSNHASDQSPHVDSPQVSSEGPSANGELRLKIADSLLGPVAEGCTATKIKSSKEFQKRLWAAWPTEEDWRARMDIYFAAAYLRISPDTIRRAVTVSRDGKARLAHQRFGSICRIKK